MFPQFLASRNIEVLFVCPFYLLNSFRQSSFQPAMVENRAHVNHLVSQFKQHALYSFNQWVNQPISQSIKQTISQVWVLIYD